MRTTFIYANGGTLLSERINEKIKELEKDNFVIINVAYQLAIKDRHDIYTALITYEPMMRSF